MPLEYVIRHSDIPLALEKLLSQQKGDPEAVFFGKPYDGESLDGLVIKFQLLETEMLRDTGLREENVQAPIAHLVYEAYVTQSGIVAKMLGWIRRRFAEKTVARYVDYLTPRNVKNPSRETYLRTIREEAERLYQKHGIQIVLEHHGDINAILPYLGIG